MGEKRKFGIVFCEEKVFESGKVLYKCIGSDGQKYDCWEPKIKEFMGKGEHEFEVYSKQRGEYTDWYIDLKEPGQKSGGGKGGGRGSYVVAFRDTREGAILSAKTMTLSYAHDLAIKFQEYQAGDIAAMIAATKKAYAEMLAWLDLDKIPAEAAPAGEKKNGAKSVAELVAEIRALPAPAMFGEWWNTNQPHIKKLTQDQLKELFAEKAKTDGRGAAKCAEVDNPVAAGDIPF